MKISILTPTLNSENYILRAINSVIAQNYDDYEHIIADGGSTDHTIDIIKEYSNIKYISEKDKGQSDAMNKAFKLSDGDVIVYLNADDEFLPGAFNNIVNAFKQNPNADMVVGNLLYKTETSEVKRVSSAKYKEIFQYWLNLFPNNPVSYFYKRKVQLAIGDFPLDNHYAMDMWFLLNAYKQFNIIKINETLGIFHSDGTNKTANSESGYHLHTVVKAHLFKHNPILIPYFYTKLYINKLFSLV
jgi:glycosyltransferase involved in cell wall biosynthesis